jgi:hypothetical protein
LLSSRDPSACATVLKRSCHALLPDYFDAMCDRPLAWDHPDNKFADAVLTPVAKERRAQGAVTEFRFGGQRRSTARSTAPDDDQQRAVKRTLPARSKQLNMSSISADASAVSPTNGARPMGGIITRRWPVSRADWLSGACNDTFGRDWHDFACNRTEWRSAPRQLLRAQSGRHQPNG